VEDPAYGDEKDRGIELRVFLSGGENEEIDRYGVDFSREV
jgi:hypothetical protein